MPLEIRQFPCLNDNYGYLIRDEATGFVATIDTPDADAINKQLALAGWELTHILNTHHHWDHTGGNLALKEKWGCEIVGPKGEADRIPGADLLVDEGNSLSFGQTKTVVLDTPGHTAGHIVYYFPSQNAAFVGDTIFAMGCGRLFEGTADQMWNSLSKISTLPPQTKLYCAHEYTQSNADFALSVDPQNDALKIRAQEVIRLRSEGKPTVPTNVSQELATNPFLRVEDETLKATLGMTGASAVETFAELRARKDNF